MKTSTLSACLATASILASAPAVAQTDQPQPRLEGIQDLELRRLLVEMRGDVEARQREWLSAKAALDSARDLIAATEARFARDDAIRARLGLQGTSELRAQGAAALAADRAKLPALEQAEETTSARYRGELQRFQNYAAAALRAPPSRIVEASTVSRPNPAQCSIDTPQDRLQLVPNCVLALRGGAATTGPDLSQARMTIEDRVLDRRGVTTQISVGSTTSTATLRIADSFNNRIVPVDSGPFRQRIANWGYSLGIQTQLDKSRSARLAGVAEADDDRRIGNLDRLDAGLSVTGGISRNYFRPEGEASFQQRATAMATSARAACRADQAGKTPAAPSTCDGEQLIAWIFARKADGSYANQTHVDAFNQSYWGAHQRVAQFGFGLNFEVARPSFSFYPFRTVTVPDPFSRGNTTQVIDRSFVPNEFIAGTPIVERHWAHSVGAYGFYHIPFYPSDRANSHFGVTVVPSLTYKVSYVEPTSFQVCLPRPSDLVTTNELCRTVNIADGRKQETWVLGLEGRALFRGGRIFFGRGLVPEFAIAPRYTFDTRTDRSGLDIPLWFAFDDKGQLNGGLRFAWEFGGDDAKGAPRRSATGVYIHFGTTFNISGK